MKGAQLVITTQNSILLQSGVLRKDQVWFVEKDRFEAAHLYSLADFKSTLARKRDNYEDNYLRGRYGAIPSVNLAQSFGEEAGERESTWPAEK
jgi:AAA15 family ATPase/GTPase